MTLELQRIQKLIAQSGFASRREAEALIEQGRVWVDGAVAKLGDKAPNHCQIRIDGKPLKRAQASSKQLTHQHLMLHKPEGYITTRKDPQGRKTVFDLLPKAKQGRWISVGRLDINTSGLLLFTTDGDLANRLTHPSAKLEREYLCKIFGSINDSKINKLKAGVKLKDDGVFARFNRVTITESKHKQHWVKVILSQGRYREVRRLWQAVDCQVNRLIRIRYGQLTLPRNLAKGQYREFSVDEVL